MHMQYAPTPFADPNVLQIGISSLTRVAEHPHSIGTSRALGQPSERKITVQVVICNAALPWGCIPVLGYRQGMRNSG